MEILPLFIEPEVFQQKHVAPEEKNEPSQENNFTDLFTDLFKSSVEDIKEPVLLPVEKITFPAVKAQVKSGSTDRIYSIHSEMNKFIMSKKRHEKQTGEKLDAYMVILPGEGIDNITGKPHEAIVDYFREHLVHQTNEI